MATTTTSTTSTLGQLGSAYNSTQISSLVQLAVYSEQNKVTSLTNSQSTLTTTQSAISSLQSSIAALSAAVNNIMAPGAMDTKQVQSSNTSAVSSTVLSSAAAGTYALNVTSLAASYKLGSTALADLGATISAAEGAGTKTFSLTSGGVTEKINVDIAAGDTDNAVMTKIVSAITGGSSLATASLVKETSGSTTLVIEAKNSGTAAQFSLSDTSGTLLRSAGVLDTKAAPVRVLQAASDASFTLGDSLTITRPTNEISDGITGVTVDLLQLGRSTLTVSDNTSAVANNFSAFVNAYNSAQNELRTQLNETPDASDVNKGILYGNSQLRGLSNQLRMTLAGSRNLAFSSLSNVGIKPVDSTTAAVNDAANLTFDSTAFQAALHSNHGAVNELITGTSGIFTQLKTQLDLDTKVPGGTLDMLAASTNSRETALAKQLAEAQADLTAKTTYYTSLYTTLAGQITTMQQQQQSFSSIYGNYYTASTTTTS